MSHTLAVGFLNKLGLLRADYFAECYSLGHEDVDSQETEGNR
jgi:hypothetical protein